MLPQFLARVRAFLRRRQLEADLNDELQQHLERETARNVERGLAPSEAHRVAHLAIGNLTNHAEDGRAAVTGILADQLAQDVRYATRGLRRNPVFALVAILSLGLGIGATTTVFSTIDALDFRPLPFHDPDRLAFLAEVAPASNDFCGGCPSDVSAPTALDWFGQVRSYAAAGAVGETSVKWVHDDVIERLEVTQATPGFFRLLGVNLQFGRDFQASDTLTGSTPAVIVTHSFWMQRLAGDARAIGKPFPFSSGAGTDATLRGAIVIGVLPERFRFGVTRERPVWVPLRLQATAPRTFRALTVVARLQDDVSFTAASTELRTVSARLAAADPVAYKEWGARVEPLRGRLGWAAGNNRRLLFGITSLVLIVAVVNVAGLMAGRASIRRQEFAMRSAFGASRRRLLRQMLVEGTCVGLGGGLIGILVAYWGVGLSSDWFDIENGVATLDYRVLAFALVLSVSVGIVTALGPALGVSRADLVSDVRGKGLSVANRGTGIASNALIVTQIALGLILLTGAASLSADFVKLRYADLGFDPEGIYTTSISVPRQDGQDFGIWRLVAEDVRARVASIPGVHSATLEYRSGMHPNIVRAADGGTVPPRMPSLLAVGPDYFTTWGMQVLRGRTFGTADGAGAARVAIVNRSAASRLWPGQNPVGHQIFVGDSGAAGEVLTVIGESADREWGEMVERHSLKVYRPLAQAKLWHTAGSLQIRIHDSPDRAALLLIAQARVRETLQRAADPFQSAEAELDRRLRVRKLNAIALNFFAVFGLALAAMGVYASISAAVTRRTREIGVRIALGATPTGTLRLVVQRGVVLAVAGVALGLAGAGAMAQVLRSLVAGTDVLDSRVFATAAGVMILTAVLAAWLPARRVLRVDPVDALRAD